MLIEALKRVLSTDGADALAVNDLTEEDLPVIAWAGNPAHLRSVARMLQRAASGECDYLAVRAPGGEPVAIGQIDYMVEPGAGTLCQLAVHTELQGLGLGTRLIAAAEQRIREGGLRWAVMGVEEANERARALYERLGYRAYRREHESWEAEDEQGNIYLHESEVVLMKKGLAPMEAGATGTDTPKGPVG